MDIDKWAKDKALEAEKLLSLAKKSKRISKDDIYISGLYQTFGIIIKIAKHYHDTDELRHYKKQIDGYLSEMNKWILLKHEFSVDELALLRAKHLRPIVNFLEIKFKYAADRTFNRRFYLYVGTITVVIWTIFTNFSFFYTVLQAGCMLTVAYLIGYFEDQRNIRNDKFIY